jgi:hypothetical protein
LELTRLPEVVEGWRQAHNLASNVAVDAISFKEQFLISQTGKTRGMTISDPKISGEEWDRLVQNVHEFEALFTSVFRGQILCAAFVFQFQSIDQNLGNLLVHIVPSHTSKASPDIITILEEVAQICDSQNLRVIARSFDGDGSYRRYHVDIAQYAREIMARLEQICAEFSDREREDEEEMPTGDDDRGVLSWNRGEEASGFKRLITGQVGEDTSMKYDVYPDKMLFNEFEGFLAICFSASSSSSRPLRVTPGRGSSGSQIIHHWTSTVLQTFPTAVGSPTASFHFSPCFLLET